MRLLGDRLFVLIVSVLVLGGLAMFFSASLGLLARENASVTHIFATQLILGLIPGIIALLVLRFMPSKYIAGGTMPFYILCLALTVLVFIPGIGVHANGASRWLNLGFATLQPAEFLKIGTILMLGGYLAYARGRIATLRSGLLPFMAILGVPVVLLLLQPNTSTVIVLSITCMVMYFLAGAPWRDFGILLLIAVVGLSALVWYRPYLQQRVMTFIHPSSDSHATGYQIQQSLIAIGSGGVLGRGFGQSVQKFNYLPEAVDDSVFAVFGEEFGFVGAIALILLFAGFAARGFRIASEASTAAGAYVVAGLTLMIVLSAFLNIGAMLGVLPLTGLPLPFVSHGGTALFTALAAVGIILNIAASRRKTRGEGGHF
jgi:cell division protein FtsW